MFEITKIERASNAKPLYHLYADDVLLLTITEETLLHFLLSKGKELSEQKLEEIHRFDQIQQCVQQALRYLSRRGHFVLELKRKLRNKGFRDDIIEQALKYLQGKNYLNDDQLTAQFVHDGIHLKKYGPLLLKKKLFEKGVAADIIERHVQQAYPLQKQEELARQLLEKKLRSLPPDLPPVRRNQKIAAFLQQRGFSWNVIQSVLNELPAE